MLRSNDYSMLLWLALVLAAVAVIARGVWLYRASLTWPTSEGVITVLNVERKRGASIASGYYFCATFTYEFLDTDGRRLSGTWYKNFSTEPEARDFAARELPVGKAVVVRFNPRNPASTIWNLTHGPTPMTVLPPSGSREFVDSIPCALATQRICGWSCNREVDRSFSM